MNHKDNYDDLEFRDPLRHETFVHRLPNGKFVMSDVELAALKFAILSDEAFSDRVWQELSY